MTVLTFGSPDKPSTVEFDQRARMISWTMAGQLRFSAVVEQLVSLVEHEDFDRSYGILVDTGGATFEGLRPSHMVTILDATRESCGGRRAIVLADTSLGKIADFFMRLRGNDGRVRLFKSRDDALNWLAKGYPHARSSVRPHSPLKSPS